MSWNDDPLFDRKIEGASRYRLTPCLRLSIITPWQDLDPNESAAELQALFDCFRPVLERDCERLVFQKRATGRESKRAPKKTDWVPFQTMAAVGKPGSGNFLYESEVTGNDYGESCGASFARFTYSSEIRFDLHAPVADFLDGSLDLPLIQRRLAAVPHRCSRIGFGLARAESSPNDLDALLAVAEKYPTLDIMKAYDYMWFGPYHDKPESHWLTGIGWITGVGQPFLEMLGGHDAIVNDLPDEIEAWQSPTGTSFFKIGDHPIAGAMGEDGDLLSLYFVLGQRLAPPTDGYPSTQYRPVGIWDDTSDPESIDLAWHRRFFDGPNSKWMKRSGRA